MDPALAKSALSQIAMLDITEKVTFHVMGEPLLHPNFFEILDHSESVALPVGLTTNGGLLTPSIVARLAEKNLYQIDISLQTPDKSSFEATRGGHVDFSRYRDSMLNLLEACSRKTKPPIFKFRIMITRHARTLLNRLRIPDFMSNSESLRKNILEWTTIVHQRLGIPISDPTRLLKRISKIGVNAWNVIEILPNIFIETYVLTDWGNAFSKEEIIPASHGYCFGMRDHFGILYSGDVTLCCVDYDGKTAIGNLNESSLLEILQSKQLEEIVRGFRKGRLVHPYCRRCLGSGSWLNSIIKPVASVIGLKILKPLFYRKHKLFD
jgi:sulfatase maturation enzyme AslB (radical SAM superfamily)